MHGSQGHPSDYLFIYLHILYFYINKLLTGYCKLSNQSTMIFFITGSLNNLQHYLNIPAHFYFSCTSTKLITNTAKTKTEEFHSNIYYRIILCLSYITGIMTRQQSPTSITIIIFFRATVCLPMIVVQHFR